MGEILHEKKKKKDEGNIRKNMEGDLLQYGEGQTF